MTALVTDGLAYWAQNKPDAPAIVFDGTDVISYGELANWTDGAAHALAARGVVAGDRIGMIGANSLEWSVAAIGALKLGAIVVPYNNRFVAAELAYLVDNSEPALVLADGQHRPQMAEGLRIHGGGVEVGPLGDFTELRSRDHEPLARLDAEPDDLAVLVYTSGTSSRPKGVPFTHRSTNAFITEWAYMEPGFSEGKGIIFVLSLSGAPGLLWHVLQPLTRGMTIYYEKGFDAGDALKRLASGKVHVMVGVPVLFEQIALQPGFVDADLSALELVTVAGARVSIATIKAWLDKGVTLRQAYGMTELGGNSTANSKSQALSRPESVGRDGMFTKHRIVRPDGSECDPEEPGEITVQGPAVTTGYWRNEAATAEALRNGWFHSGDVGIRDKDGYLRIVDRMKDLIISGGFNVAPSEIESVIAEISGVDEVCVISVDDEKFGETPAAVIVAKQALSARVVVEACRAKLAKFKVPSYVIFQEEPLPRMASGKVARRLLRENYVDIATSHKKVN